MGIAGSFPFSLDGFFGFEGQTPEDCRKADEQSHISDIIHQAVRHYFATVTSASAEHISEDQVSQPGAIWHYKCAEHRAFHTGSADRFEPPHHQERTHEKERQTKPWRGSARALQPMVDSVVQRRE